MIRVGLTGGIGAGKSTVAEWFRVHQVPVLDTDDVAREQVAPGQPALTEITDRFGPGCLKTDGSLDRAVLARLVFQSSEARRDLESILHPRIQRVWTEKLAAWQSGGERMGVVVIPLLFEKGYPSFFDTILAVGCSTVTQRIRLRASGWTETEIDSRIAAQWPMTAKLEAAHCVLWNEGTLHCLHAQLERWHLRKSTSA